MKQLIVIKNRLKNPSVLLSIISQLLILAAIFNPKLDTSSLVKHLSSLASIFVILGITSNPSTKNKGYGDDIHKCANCNKDTVHVVVNGKLVCEECGQEITPKK